jgi:hypothetical protein
VELAQLICKRSSELGAAGEPNDVPGAALNLVRTSRHDRTMLDHASVIFRTRLQAHPDDEASKDGLSLLTRVLAFLR